MEDGVCGELRLSFCLKSLQVLLHSFMRHKACWVIRPDIFLCAIKLNHSNLFGLLFLPVWFTFLSYNILIFSLLSCSFPPSYLSLFIFAFLSLCVSFYISLSPLPPPFLPCPLAFLFFCFSSFPQLMATNTQMVSLPLSVSHPVFSFSFTVTPPRPLALNPAPTHIVSTNQSPS